VRLAGAVMPGGDEPVQLLTQCCERLARCGLRRRAGGCAHRGPGGRGRGPARERTSFAVSQQQCHLLGLEQSRQTEEVFLLGCHAELVAVIQDAVEMRRRLQRLERPLLEPVGSVSLPQRLGERALIVGSVVGQAQDVVALGLEFGGVPEQRRDGRQEH
jgi:hypothetical protein